MVIRAQIDQAIPKILPVGANTEPKQDRRNNHILRALSSDTLATSTQEADCLEPDVRLIVSISKVGMFFSFDCLRKVCRKTPAAREAASQFPPPPAPRASGLCWHIPRK